MLKKLIILFNKKNEQAIRNQYMSLLQTLKNEMKSQGVATIVNFVEEDMDKEQPDDTTEDAVEVTDVTNDTTDITVTADETDVVEDTDEIFEYTRDIENTIYITDTPAHFDMFKLWGYHAVALIHDYNKDASFRNVSYLIDGLEGLEYNYLDKVYRRMAGIPWDILETERLYVRESTVKDVDDFYRIYKEPSITYYMENLFEEPDMERMYMKNYIRRVYGFYEYGMWTVILKKTGHIIGRAGLSVRDGYDLPELGFVIEVEHQGQGYATEVCSAILAYAKEELQMEGVQALVCAENKASIALLKNLGFFYKENVTEGGQDYQLWIKDLIGEKE